MDDLTKFVDLILAANARLEYKERLCWIQAETIRNLEAELAKRDAMIAQAVEVMLPAIDELKKTPVLSIRA